MQRLALPARPASRASSATPLPAPAAALCSRPCAAAPGAGGTGSPPFPTSEPCALGALLEAPPRLRSAAGL